EQRAQALYMFAFYAFCALAFMAKGIPGFALPALCVFFYLCAARRFQLLFDGRLHVAAGALTLIVLGLPWFVAMYMRHGSGFTDRILIHDHINRLTSGVHGDNGTIQYFIWQLGYGLFPWFGLVPAGLAIWLFDARASRTTIETEAGTVDTGRSERETLFLLGLWFAVSFTLFSAMTTKFHHYILPAVPPAAALVGLLIDRMLPARAFSRTGHALWRTLAAMLGSLTWVLAAAGLRGDVRGIVPADVPSGLRARWVLEHPWPTWLCLGLFTSGLALFVLALRKPRIARSTTTPPLQLGAAVIAGAVVLAFVGRDLAWHTRELPPGSERLIHLFVYNYTRIWPDHLDYRAILFGFAVVAVIATAACAVQRLRAAAAGSLIALGLAFCVFCLDVYMTDLSPHWSQSGLIQRYYATRGSKDEPLLAWQMNWKGENFYTGNHVHVFVDLDNKAMQEWIGKNTGRHVFFILEHTRLDRLKRLLAPRNLETLTTARDCNKFVLLRATL
ncbi:MAG: hypothetical protein ABW321_07750, partial [Polyangiales bacterium]